jgi:hypothetical protein
VNKFAVSSLLVLLSAVVAVPTAIAQTEAPNETRIEKYEDLTETEADMTSQTDMEGMEMEYEDGISQPETRTEETLQEAQSSDFDYNNYDVRRTEAFNLVSSAYRGDFEDQGINGYAILLSNYETGEVTAEDIINAAIESGELSPMALEDSSYVEAVDSQLNVLTES